MPLIFKAVAPTSYWGAEVEHAAALENEDGLVGGYAFETALVPGEGLFGPSGVTSSLSPLGDFTVDQELTGPDNWGDLEVRGDGLAEPGAVRVELHINGEMVEFTLDEVPTELEFPTYGTVEITEQP